MLPFLARRRKLAAADVGVLAPPPVSPSKKDGALDPEVTSAKHSGGRFVIGLRVHPNLDGRL